MVTLELSNDESFSTASARTPRRKLTEYLMEIDRKSKGDKSMGEVGFCERAIVFQLTNLLGRFGSDKDPWSQDRILEAIQEKNEESVKLILNYAYSYGLLDTLVAMVIITDTLASDDVIDWFRNEIKILPDYSLIIKLAEMFSEDRMKVCESYSRALYERIKDNFIIDTNYEHLSSYIWEKLDDHYKYGLRADDNRILGICCLGAYDDNIGPKYFQVFESKVLPLLLLKSGIAISYTEDSDRAEFNILKNMLFIYMYKVAGRISLGLEVLKKLLDVETKKIATDSYKEFCYMINKLIDESKDTIYASDKYVNQMAELIKAAEHFGFDRTTVSYHRIKSMMPLYYLFVGENEKAYSNLMQIAHSPVRALKWKVEYVIALYRCLLVTHDNDKRTRMLNVFEVFYTNKGIMRDFSEVISNLYSFYDNWTKRIKTEFDEKYVDFGYPEQFYTYSDQAFSNFCAEFVINDKIINEFDRIIRDLNGIDKKLGDKAVSDAVNLVLGLTSHDDTCIRIDISDVMRGLNIDSIPFQLNDNEINGDIYTEHELERVRDLKDKMETLRSHMLEQSSIDIFHTIKERTLLYWDMSDVERFCAKVITGLKKIQSEPSRMWMDKDEKNPKKEEDLNSLLSLFLSGYYNVANVQREAPNGYSQSGKQEGKLDIGVYKEDILFAIIEGVRLLRLGRDGKFTDTDRTNIKDHIEKLKKNYDSIGVEVKILVTYAYVDDAEKTYDAMDEFLQSELASEGKVEKVPEEGSGICHHKWKYMRDGLSQDMHIYTVILRKIDEEK